MSVSICTECLSRLRVSKGPSTSAFAVAASAIPHASSFHSSAAQYKSPLLKKKTLAVTVSRRSTGVRLKKKVREKVNIPAVGERRAARKRIVLSNTNALEVLGLETLSPENMVLEESKGRVLAFDGQLLDQLRDSQAFKTTQNWNMFRRPATLIRSETIAVARDIEEVAATKGKNIKHLVTGERGSGKSMLMLQAMSMAFMKGWVVVNIPEAQDFVTNTSSYVPIRASAAAAQTSGGKPTEQMYSQPQLAQALLNRIVYANEIVLSELKLNHFEEHPKTLRLSPSATLNDLAQVGSQDHTLASIAWQALWKELTTSGANPRPPVLVAVDGVDHWFGPTKYRSADFEVIHAQQFAIVKRFTDLFFSGETASPLANGGLLFFSTSGSNNYKFPSFEVLLKQFRARSRGVSPNSSDFPLQDPYSKPDPRVTGLFSRAQGVKFLEVNGTSKPESKGILEYFARSGLLQEQLSEKAVADLRALSAGGVLGELARLGSRLKM